VRFAPRGRTLASAAPVAPAHASGRRRSRMDRDQCDQRRLHLATGGTHLPAPRLPMAGAIAGVVRPAGGTHARTRRQGRLSNRDGRTERGWRVPRNTCWCWDCSCSWRRCGFRFCTRRRRLPPVRPTSPRSEGVATSGWSRSATAAGSGWWGARHGRQSIDKSPIPVNGSGRTVRCWDAQRSAR